MKKGDFITVVYTGRLSDGVIFDTTDAEVAKKSGITKPVAPVTICLGESHLLPGLDTALIGKELGKHTIKLEAENAFGKKSTKKMELIPIQVLKKQGINPQPGMELEIDNKYGVVRTISGGRVVVDFNHPLAGQDVVYDVDAQTVVTDLVAQVKALLDVPRLPYEAVENQNNNIIIKVPQMYPQNILDAVQKKITELTDAKNVSFEQGKKN